ncbi:MAG: MCE family protein [Myxococcales bacterium]|nr:MCE family protein [Myxococcales bacterium]
MPLRDLTPQLRTRLLRMERLVGLFVSVAAGLTLAGFVYYLYHTAEQRGWFVPSIPYYTFVGSADGLQVGDPVFLLGFSVGEITLIEAQPPSSYYNVFVAFEIRQPYYGYVWTDSKAKIISGDILGGRRIEITKGVEGHATAQETDGRIEAVWIDEAWVLMEDAPKGVGLDPQEEVPLGVRAQALLSQIEAALPGLLENLDRTLANTSALSEDAGRVIASTERAMADIEEITANLTDPDGSLGEWLLPPDVKAGLTDALATVNADLLELQKSLENVGAMTGSLREQVESNDRVLSEISSLVVDTDDLVQGLKRHWLFKGAFPAPPARGGTTPTPLEPLMAPAAEDRP